MVTASELRAQAEELRKSGGYGQLVEMLEGVAKELDEREAAADAFTHKEYSLYLFAWSRGRFGQEASTCADKVEAYAANALGLRDGLRAHTASRGFLPQTFAEAKSEARRELDMYVNQSPRSFAEVSAEIRAMLSVEAPSTQTPSFELPTEEEIARTAWEVDGSSWESGDGQAKALVFREARAILNLFRSRMGVGHGK